LTPSLFEFTFHLLPWATSAVFTAGMILQVVKWLGGAPSGSVGEGGGGVGVRAKIEALVLDLVVQRRMLRDKASSIGLWVVSWALFHIPLAFIIFGHFRMTGVWSVEWFTWLMPAEFLVKTLPMMMGYVVLLGVIFLTLGRLFSAAPRSISTLENYAVLLLVLAIIAIGNIMRLLPPSPEPLAVTLPPGITLRVEYTPSTAWLSLHALLAQVLIMCLPFSRLIHILGGVVVTLARAGGHGG